jgi:hypothetical protein
VAEACWLADLLLMQVMTESQPALVLLVVSFLCHLKAGWV